MLNDSISVKDNIVKKNLWFECKKKTGKKAGGGGVPDSWLDVRKGGGGHSDAYRVQQGGWGGSKNQEKMRM